MADYNENAIYKSTHAGLTIDEAIEIALKFDPTGASNGQVPSKASDGTIEWVDQSGGGGESYFEFISMDDVNLDALDAIMGDHKIPVPYIGDFEEGQYIPYLLVDGQVGIEYYFLGKDFIGLGTLDYLVYRGEIEDWDVEASYAIEMSEYKVVSSDYEDHITDDAGYPTVKAVADAIERLNSTLTSSIATLEETLTTSINTKINRDMDAVEGNIAVFNDDGHITDSGYSFGQDDGGIYITI